MQQRLQETMKEFNHDISLDKEKLKRKEKALLNGSRKKTNKLNSRIKMV